MNSIQINDENDNKLNKIMNMTAHKQFNRLGTAANTISLSTSSPLIAKYMNLSTFSGGSVTVNENDNKTTNSSLSAPVAPPPPPPPSTTNVTSSEETNSFSTKGTTFGSSLNPESYLSTKLNV